MKKLIILLLALTLILGVFASCNKRYLYIDDETSSSPIESIYETSNEETSNEKTSESTSEETNEPPKTSDTAVTVDTIESIDGTEGGTTEIVDTGTTSNEYNYTLEKVDDQWYMVFDDYVDYPHYPLAYLFFETDSMETIKQMIFNKELDSEQKRIILEIGDRDEIGISIPKILDPVLPSDMAVYQAFWYADHFVVSFISEDYKIDGYMDFLDEAQFTEQYNAASEENIYVSEDGTKTVVFKQVKNQYVDTDLLYIKIGDNYACFSINGMPDNPDKDLIMSFGFEALT